MESSISVLLALPSEVFTEILSAAVAFGSLFSSAEEANAESVRDFVFLSQTCKGLWHLGTVGCAKTVWHKLASLICTRSKNPSLPQNTDIDPKYWYKLVISQLHFSFAPLAGYLLGVSTHTAGFRCDHTKTNRLVSPEEMFDALDVSVNGLEGREKCPHQPCPDEENDRYRRHIFGLHFEWEAHFQFIPWLAARLRFGPEEWLFSPPESHDCPYIGHTEGFLIARSPLDCAHSVRVNLDDLSFDWCSFLHQSSFSEVFSKFGNGDGDLCISGNENDDYHLETVARAEQMLRDSELFDMERSTVFLMPTFHNPFRAELYYKDGPIGQGGFYWDTDFSIWIEQYCNLTDEFPPLPKLACYKLVNDDES